MYKSPLPTILCFICCYAYRFHMCVYILGPMKLGQQLYTYIHMCLFHFVVLSGTTAVAYSIKYAMIIVIKPTLSILYLLIIISYNNKKKNKKNGYTALYSHFNC